MKKKYGVGANGGFDFTKELKNMLRKKMGIAAAKGIGIKLIGVDAKDFIDKTPHMVLTFVW